MAVSVLLCRDNSPVEPLLLCSVPSELIRFNPFGLPSPGDVLIRSELPALLEKEGPCGECAPLLGCNVLPLLFDNEGDLGVAVNLDSDGPEMKLSGRGSAFIDMLAISCSVS